MSKDHRIGIMGGRLSYSIENKIQSFPINSWRDEFKKAADCGFDLIEWVFDADNNPIFDDDKITEIKHLIEKYGVRINSVCADYFMEKQFFDTPTQDIKKNIEILKKLIKKCNELGIKILEIPLVDQSSLKNEQQKKQFFDNMQNVLELSEKNDIILNLETDLPAMEFRDFVTSFESKSIRINYDIGNSTSLGYNIKEEFEILGKLITNVHIKDRLLHGTTVSLGTGDVDYELFFQMIKKIDYRGDFIIQGARENESITTPENTCKKYLKFIKHYIDKYLL